MENTGIRTEVIDEIRILARKYDVNKVILSSVLRIKERNRRKLAVNRQPQYRK
ncbi:MAG: hypothetical protein PUE84_02235 [Firmicutes bacterium]|nr:hypothetical protein [Bacillota bacterium]